MEKVIMDWFIQNRPDLYEQNEITKEYVENIFDQIKGEIIDLDKSVAIIIVHEFLRLYYSSVVFNVLDEIVSEEPYSKLFDDYRSLGFMYRSELASIMLTISEKRILDKYIVNDTLELFDNENFRNDLKTILNDYMKIQ